MSKLHNPTDIKLHQKSKILEIAFDDGNNFKLPCEYLRTHAKSSEILATEKPVAGKADVNIINIEQQGNYALRLYFDDGYNIGIFSWGTLHELGSHYDANWKKYLELMERYGLNRNAGVKPADAK